MEMTASPAPLIKLTGVSAGYPGREVLKHIDLLLNAGERLALLGANGAGKSTLLHVLTGFIPLRSGTIEAFGRAPRTEKDFREVRARAGLIFQDANDQLFCPTVLEDVAFGPLNLGQSRDEARQTAQTILAELGLQSLESRITHHLSGGERGLVSIAAVLAMRPQVLLLDEPTVGLDAHAYARLLDILRSLPQAMIIVAHDAEFVSSLATSALLIRDGISHAGTVHAHPHRHSHPHIHFDGDGSGACRDGAETRPTHAVI